MEMAKAIWIGVGAAVALSLTLGAVLTYTSKNFGNKETFSGSAGLLAVALVTWMVFWMKQTARFMKNDLEERLSLAVGTGALILAAFTAVAREGLETALFLYANFQTTNAFMATVGLFAGLAAAIILGYSVYKGSAKFNIALFFKVSGVALILIAGNVLRVALADLSWLTGLSAYLAVSLYILLTIPLYLKKSKVFASR